MLYEIDIERKFETLGVKTKIKFIIFQIFFLQINQKNLN